LLQREKKLKEEANIGSDMNESTDDNQDSDGIFNFIDDDNSSIESPEKNEEKYNFVYKETVCFLPNIGDECLWCLQDEVFNGVCLACGNEET
jgi:hypothetical protein